MVSETKDTEKPRANGKYHGTADLLLDWFGFDQRSKIVVHST